MAVHATGGSEEALFRSLFELNPDAVFALDGQGRFTRINGAAERLTGYSPAELIGQSWDRVIDPLASRQVQGVIMRAVAGLSQSLEATMTRRDGQRRRLSLTLIPILMSGETAGVYAIGKDVTEQRRTEQALQEQERLYRLLAENSRDMIVLYGPDGSNLFVSPAVEAIVGYTGEEYAGLDPATVVHPEDVDGLLQARAWLIEGHSGSVTFRMRHRLGHYVCIETLVTPVFDNQGRLLQTVATSRDVTERMAMQEHLLFLDQVGKVLAESLDSRETLTALANLIVRHLADVCVVEVLHSDGQLETVTEVFRDPARHRGLHRESVLPVIRSGQAVLSREDPNRPSSYMVLPLQARGRILGALTLLSDGANRRYVSADLDTAKELAARTALALDNARLFERANWTGLHDPLTRLPNRIMLFNRLQACFAERQEQGPDAGQFALLFLDLDSFKVINDSMGHHVGDRLLRVAANRIGRVLEPDSLLCRLGGDEFVLLLPDTAEPEAMSMAERVLECLRNRGVDGITASIGIVMASQVTGPDDMLRCADIAMYHAKRRGRARYAMFTRELDRAALDRLNLEMDLRNALRSGQLTLHYQPIVELGDGRVVAVEALLRWFHPTRGVVPPDQFIPVAEESGLIVEMGEWVLTQACMQVRYWQETLRCPDLSLSVNLSSRQVHDERFLERLDRVLAETGFDPSRLQLEITERLLVGDDDGTRAVLHAIQAIGIQLALDDFGTGYSSLNYLKHFPIQVLKVDKSFTAELGIDPQSTAIVEAVMAVARALRLQVVAEGVESPEQLAHLIALGCQRGQGYYFARPAPSEQIAGLLARTR